MTCGGHAGDVSALTLRGWSKRFAENVESDGRLCDRPLNPSRLRRGPCGGAALLRGAWRGPADPAPVRHRRSGRVRVRGRPIGGRARADRRRRPTHRRTHRGPAWAGAGDRGGRRRDGRRRHPGLRAHPAHADGVAPGGGRGRGSDDGRERPLDAAARRRRAGSPTTADWSPGRCSPRRWAPSHTPTGRSPRRSSSRSWAPVSRSRRHGARRARPPPGRSMRGQVACGGRPSARARASCS